MDPSNGRIYDPDEMEELYAREYDRVKNFPLIPQGELSVIEAMNRHERRKWAKEQRKRGNPPTQTKGSE